MVKSPTPKRTILLLFLVCVLGYVLTSSGYIDMTDGMVVYLVTASIVDHGVLYIADPGSHTYAIAGHGAGEPSYSMQGRDGHYYMKYGLGWAVAQIPFYVSGKLAAYAAGTDSDLATGFFCSFQSALWSAAAAAVLCAFFLKLGLTRGQAVAAALIYAFATIAWPYAKMSYSESLQAFLIIAAAFVLWTPGRAPIAPVRAVVAGFLFGFLLFVKPINFFLLPAWVALLVARERTFRGMLLFVAATVPFVLLILALNKLRFGGFFETGFGEEALTFNTPLLHGLWILFLSSARGMLWYNPLILVAVAGAFLAWRRNRRLALFSSLAFLAAVAVYAKWHYVSGGRSWGPRFLVALWPATFLPGAFVLQASGRRRTTRVVAMIVVALGILVQIPAVFEPWYFAEGMEAEVMPEAFSALPPPLLINVALLGHDLLHNDGVYPLKLFGVESDEVIDLSSHKIHGLDLWYLHAARHLRTRWVFLLPIALVLALAASLCLLIRSANADPQKVPGYDSATEDTVG